MVVDPNQNQKNPSQPNVGRMIFAGIASNFVSKLIIYIPVIIIWVIAFWLISKSHWLVGITPNIRGPLIIGIFVVPLIIAAIVQYKLRDYFYRKLEK
jgi:hypothetical protein